MLLNALTVRGQVLAPETGAGARGTVTRDRADWRRLSWLVVTALAVGVFGSTGVVEGDGKLPAFILPGAAPSIFRSGFGRLDCGDGFGRESLRVHWCRTVIAEMRRSMGWSVSSNRHSYICFEGVYGFPD